MPQGRWFRPRDTGLKGTGYDSKLEQRLHQGPLRSASHHTQKIPYTISHNYEPDFTLDRETSQILIESKGYFMDREDATKYLWIREALPETSELVFCFEHPTKAIHFQSTRKDGTKMTHSEWAEKNGFRWFTEESISEIVNESPPNVSTVQRDDF